MLFIFYQQEEEDIEKDTDNDKNLEKSDEDNKPKKRFQFLQSFPFTKFLQQAPKENGINGFILYNYIFNKQVINCKKNILLTIYK